MVDTFSPSQVPSRDTSSATTDYRLITASFGDGYRLDMPDGLNASLVTATYQWDYASAALRDYIVGFLNSHIARTFIYAPPDNPGPTKWRALRGAVVTPRGADAYQVSIQLTQSYEIVS